MFSLRTVSLLNLIIFALLLASPIRAQVTDVSGWQEARWNMSEAEILEAFKTRLTKLEKRIVFADKTGYADYAIPDYEIEGNKFNVYFDMSNETQKLMDVRIRLQEEKSIIPKDTLYFPRYEELLTRKYGVPAFKNDERTSQNVSLERLWVFKTTTIKLSYSWLGADLRYSWLTITYFPSSVGDINKI